LIQFCFRLPTFF